MERGGVTASQNTVQLQSLKNSCKTKQNKTNSIFRESLAYLPSFNMV